MQLHELQATSTGRTSPACLFARLAVLGRLAPKAILARLFDTRAVTEAVVESIGQGLPEPDYRMPLDKRHFERFVIAVFNLGMSEALAQALADIAGRRGGDPNPSLQLARHILGMEFPSILGEHILAEDVNRIFKNSEDARSEAAQAIVHAGELTSRVGELSSRVQEGFEFFSARGDQLERELKRRKTVRFESFGGS